MAERVLEPLAAAPPLLGRVRTGHAVIAVGRARMTRRDMPGHPLRGERPFRILVETPRGEEVIEADAVLDASGVYDRPAAVGVGRHPRARRARPRRRAHPASRRLHAALGGLAGRDVLLVGHGHSAADALAAHGRAPRSAPRPLGHALAEPAAVRRGGRRSAAGARPRDRARQRPGRDPPAFLTVERRTGVEAFAPRDGRVAATLERRARAASSTPSWGSPDTGPTCRSSPSWPSRSRR